MNSHSTAKRPGGKPYMSERKTQAYLLARDAVRRVQRTSSLIGVISHKAAGNFNRTQSNRQQNH